MEFVKFDMHCHTAEGSVDGHVGIEEYIRILKNKGFGGMLVTDHDSYEGYLAWKRSGKKEEDFAVFKGIEYDTYDFGHMLVVMPQGFSSKILKIRGLTLEKLMKVVHLYGGVLGPAHPCGERFLSFFTTGILKGHKKDTFLKQFDFLEGYNSCEAEENNECAGQLAKEYGIPAIAGSDSHSKECVGMAYTMVPKKVKTEDDFINWIKKKPNVVYDGSRYMRTTKNKLGTFNKVLVGTFFFYNKLEAFYRLPARRRAFRKAVYEMEGFQ